MSDINTSGTLNEQLFAASESVFKRGMIPNQTEMPGAWGQRVKKTPGDAMMPDLNGMGGADTPRIRVPFQDGFGANAGSSYVNSYKGAEPVKGDQFLIPLGTLFAHSPTTRTRQALRTGSGAMLDERMLRDFVVQPQQLFWFVLSQIMWSDGNGIFGVGNGSWTLTGDTITFINRRSTRWFHKGQQITFADPLQALTPGRLAAVRAQAVPGTTPFLKVTSINQENGTVTVDVANIQAVVPAVTAADWIIPVAFLQATQSDGQLEPDYFQPPLGFFAWVPRTTNEASKDFFNVTRSDDLKARSGQRISIPAGATINDIVAALAEPITDLPVDGHETEQGTLWYPASQQGNVIKAFSRINVKVQDGGPQLNDNRTFQLGTNRQVAIFNTGHRIGLQTDRMLVDHFVTAEQDNTWVLQLDTRWKVMSTANSLRLVQDENGAVLRPVDGSSQALATTFAMWGQLIPDGVGNNIVVSPFIGDSRKTFV